MGMQGWLIGWLNFEDNSAVRLESSPKKFSGGPFCWKDEKSSFGVAWLAGKYCGGKFWGGVVE